MRNLRISERMADNLEISASTRGPYSRRIGSTGKEGKMPDYAKCVYSIYNREVNSREGEV